VKVNKMFFKKIILILVGCFFVCSPVFADDKKIQAPDYKKLLKDVKPVISYHLVETGDIISGPQKADGRDYIILKKFVGKTLKLVEYNIFEKGKEYKLIVYLFVKNSPEEHYSRIFIDNVDKNGKERADGIFDEENKY